MSSRPLPILFKVEGNDKFFQFEYPRRVFLDDVSLIKQTRLFIEHTEYENYYSCVGEKHFIVSVSNETSNPGRKAIVWLPKALRRTMVPRCEADDVSGVLKYLSNVVVKQKLPIPSTVTQITYRKSTDIELTNGLNKIASRLHWSDFKFGVLLLTKGQTTETEMYDNDETSSDFLDFLNIIGEKTRLKGFQGFSGGLDVKTDVHGEYSYTTVYETNRIMFHVGPLIPSIPGDPSRKRHIGNDIVVIIFRDSDDDADLVDLGTFKSQFNHIYIVVTPVKQPQIEGGRPKLGKDTDETSWYHVSVASNQGVKSFLPAVPNPPIFKKEDLRDWILTKCINGERVSIDEVKTFSDKMTYTRQQLLKEVLGDSFAMKAGKKIVIDL